MTKIAVLERPVADDLFLNVRAGLNAQASKSTARPCHDPFPGTVPSGARD
ncbi:hypothetical protein [Paracoccus liaowanqingii]|nr:hypothetical protein [Paracoccus liaowanqingii]